MKRILSTIVCVLLALACAAAQHTTGRLQVQIKDAVAITDNNILIFETYHNYVKVTATDSDGREVVKDTKTAPGNGNVKWYEVFEFGEGQWTELELTILAEATAGYRSDNDRIIYEIQKMRISTGHHTESRHCGSACTLHYDYDFIPKYPKGRLIVNIINGSKIPDVDKHNIQIIHRPSDPYVVVTARRMNGLSRPVNKTTGVQWNTFRPRWNTQLDFGMGLWRDFSVQVFDKDQYKDDDRLSNSKSFSLEYLTADLKVPKRVRCYSGGAVDIEYYIVTSE